MISDCSPDIPEVWDEFKFGEYFDTVIFSCETGLKKPDERIYKKAVKGLKAEFEECYYIGDGGSYELTGAEKVGVSPVLIKSKDDEAKNVYKKYTGDWNGDRIYSLLELKEYR